MRILLDTNAYSAMRRGEAWAVARVQGAEEVLLSVVVVGELLYGFRNGSRFEQNLEKLENFLAQPAVELLPVTWVTADRFGRIATALRRKGRPIPTNDMWIAAHAMEAGADLVSADLHFAEIDGLAWQMP